MDKKILSWLPRIIFIVFFVSISVLFYISSPEQLLIYVGVENAYLIMFILAIIGGMTTFSGIPYHLVLITLASGGINPLLLGLVTAIGDMIGDSTSYYIGYAGGEMVPPNIQKFLAKLYDFGQRYPKLLPVIILIYGSLSPFSNDFIVISAGLAKYPFWKVMLPLAIGNIIFNVALAFLARYGYTSLLGILF